MSVEDSGRQITSANQGGKGSESTHIAAGAAFAQRRDTSLDSTLIDAFGRISYRKRFCDVFVMCLDREWSRIPV